jgi:hypothetical protein
MNNLECKKGSAGEPMAKCVRKCRFRARGSALGHLLTATGGDASGAMNQLSVEKK